MRRPVTTITRAGNYTVNRKGWGSGDWDGEPDEISWVDPATGLNCWAIRNPTMGFWCGYVAVDEGNKYHGIDQGDDELRMFGVHGGVTLTESNEFRDRPTPAGIKNPWWFGFDCGHAQDLSPGMAALIGKRPLLIGKRPLLNDWEVYRTVEYVIVECQNLARQLIEVTCGEAKGWGSCGNLAMAPHTCPFQVDINGDSETLCRCCIDCEHQCAMDI